VIPIVLPSLRERRTDIPLLVDHFLQKYGASRPRSVSPEALKILMEYEWPGNVRQLESVIERALLLGESDQIVPAARPAAVRAGLTTRGDGLALQIPEAGIDLEALERNLILKALEKTDGNVTRAARLLGLSRRTLQYRLEKIQGAPEGTGDARK